MSMISAQVERLREIADFLESDPRTQATAPEIRCAADTIWELRNKLAGVVDQSEEIERLKRENAELRKAMDFQALELGCMTDNRDILYLENEKLRKLAHGLNWCTENAKVPSAECERCPLGDTEDGELSCEKLMRELGIEVKDD